MKRKSEAAHADQVFKKLQILPVISRKRKGSTAHYAAVDQASKRVNAMIWVKGHYRKRAVRKAK